MIRATNSGQIQFGMVNIPVKVYAATKEQRVQFKTLDPSDDTPVKQRLVNATTGAEVKRGTTKKGYEHSRGAYVVITDAELESLRPENDKCMEILEFIPAKEIDSVYFQKSSLLGPDKGGSKPYHLLRQAMLNSGKVAFGRYRARGKESLILLRPTSEGIVMNTLFFADEVRDFEQIGIKEVDISQDELELADQLVRQLSEESFQIDKHEDTFRNEVLSLIDQKVQGKEITISQTVEAKPVIDLVAALRGSLK